MASHTGHMGAFAASPWLKACVGAVLPHSVAVVGFWRSCRLTMWVMGARGGRVHGRFLSCRGFPGMGCRYQTSAPTNVGCVQPVGERRPVRSGFGGFGGGVSVVRLLMILAASHSGQLSHGPVLPVVTCLVCWWSVWTVAPHRAVVFRWSARVYVRWTIGVVIGVPWG